MSAITNPHDGLVSYQAALRKGLIVSAPCMVHRELTVLIDDANGERRLTYALVEKGVVKATVVYIMADPMNGLPCFQVGYAVARQFRNQGIGTQILAASIDEMSHGFRNHMPRFYIEAVVAQSNVESNKIAQKVLSAQPESTIDTQSGEPAFQYVRLIGGEPSSS